MSEQMIEVTISNMDIKKAGEQSEMSMIEYILSRLHEAGIPLVTWVPGQAIKASKGILMYNRSSMAQASVYTWQSDDYVATHGNEDVAEAV